MKSNYEVMKEQMEKSFASYDQDAILARFELQADDDFFYIPFCGRDYQINRKSGQVTYEEKGILQPADYNEAMTIFDVLTYSPGRWIPSGRYNDAKNLHGVVQTGKGAGGGMFKETARFFDNHFEKLADAVMALGGQVMADKRADFAARIPMFTFMPVILQFWQSDDEFDAVLKLMWDENVLSLMHYETTWFAAGHLYGRLKSLMERE